MGFSSSSSGGCRRKDRSRRRESSGRENRSVNWMGRRSQAGTRERDNSERQLKKNERKEEHSQLKRKDMVTEGPIKMKGASVTDAVMKYSNE